MAIQVTDLQLLREQLLLRRQKLEPVVSRAQTANLLQLLEQVDKALERVEAGSFGICEVCHGTLEAQRVLADPLARVCLDCLPPAEARALERDLELAASHWSKRSSQVRKGSGDISRGQEVEPS